MIIIQSRGYTCIENKLISSQDNHYFQSIEYINNEYDDVLIKYCRLNYVHYYDINYKTHNPIGPAVICYFNNGNIFNKKYLINGQRHREDGPAYVEFDINGNLKREQFWKNGINYNP